MNASMVWLAIVITIGLVAITDIIMPTERRATTRIITDCSGISEKTARRMDDHFKSCRISSGTTTCANQLPRLFCKKTIVEYNADGTVNSIHGVLTGDRIDLTNE